MIKVCYIVTKLELGGAQKVVLYTCENIDKNIFDSFIITSADGMLNSQALKKIRFIN